MKVVLGEDYILREAIHGKTDPVMGRRKKIPAESSFTFCANCHNPNLIAIVVEQKGEETRKTYFVLRREIERAGVVSQKK
jgi:hypothetical protein